MIARCEISLRVHDAAEAAEFRRYIRAQSSRLKRDFALGIRACPTVDETVDGYCLWIKTVKSSSAKRVKYVRRILLGFADVWVWKGQSVRADGVTRVQVLRWIAGRRRHACVATVNNELRVWKGYCRWLAGVERRVRLAEIESLDVPAVVDKREVQGRVPPRFVSQAEYHRIVSQLPLRIEIVLRGMLLLGARPAMLFDLCWENVEMPSGSADGRVDLPKAKGGIRGSVPVSGGEVERMLQECMQHVSAPVTAKAPVFQTRKGRAWSTRTYGEALRRALRRAGIERKFTAYTVRHSAATWLERAGVPSGGIQHYMKHLRASTQDRYRHGTGELALNAYPVMAQIVSGRIIPAARGPE